MMTPAEREAFLAERMSIVGGSDIGPITGVSPWRSEMDVYMEKIGAIEPPEQNENMKWGLIHEPAVIREFCDQFHAEVKVDVPLIRHPELFHIGYHADGLLLGEDGKPTALIEAKAPGAFARPTFGEPGTDDIPRTYFLQVQQGMELFDLSRAFVPVLFGGNRWMYFEVARNREIAADLIRIANVFWQRVIDRNPPEIDGTESSQRFLQSLYPADTGETIQADTYSTEWMAKLSNARKDKAEAEKREQLAKNKIIEKMGDAAVLEGPGFKVSYKKPNDRIKVDYKAVVQYLLDELKGTGLRNIDHGELAILVSDHTTTTPAKRVFRPTWKE